MIFQNPKNFQNIIFRSKVILTDFHGFINKIYGKNIYRIYSRTVRKILTDLPCHVEDIMDT